MKFKTNADRMIEAHKKYNTKMSNKECTLCKNLMTEAQLNYSMKVYKKALCFGCQKLSAH